MENNLPQVTFRQLVKHPVTYALMVVVSLLWFMAYMFKDSNTAVNDNCEEEKRELRADLRNERQRVKELTDALVVKNSIIDNVKNKLDTLSKN